MITLQHGASGTKYLLRYKSSFYQGNVAARALRRLEIVAEHEHIQLSSDSCRLAYELGTITTRPIAVYPIPHTGDPEGRVDAQFPVSHPLHLVSLGNARGEKGMHEILGAIRESAEESWGSQLRFTLQVNDRSDDVAAAIEAFRAKPDARTTLISEALDFEFICSTPSFGGRSSPAVPPRYLRSAHVRSLHRSIGYGKDCSRHC